MLVESPRMRNTCCCERMQHELFVNECREPVIVDWDANRDSQRYQTLSTSIKCTGLPMGK